MDQKGKIWFLLALSVSYLIGVSVGFFLSGNWETFYITSVVTIFLFLVWLYSESVNRFDIVTLERRRK